LTVVIFQAHNQFRRSRTVKNNKTVKDKYEKIINSSPHRPAAGVLRRAQWIVYDPTSNIQEILDEAENMAEYVSMIDKPGAANHYARQPVEPSSKIMNPCSAIHPKVVLFDGAHLDSDLQSLEPARTSKTWSPMPVVILR